MNCITISIPQLRPSRTAVSDTKSDNILIGSDFNVKVGKSLNSDSKQDLRLGRHSKGRRKKESKWTVTCRLVKYPQLVRL